MYIIIMIASIILLVGLINFILFKYPKRKKLISLVLFTALFAVFMFRLFSYDDINKTFNLLLFDINTPLDAESTWMFSKSLSMIILTSRWFTLIVITWILVLSFYKIKELKWLVGTLGILVSIINIILFKENIYAFQSSHEVTVRYIEFMIEVILVASISITYLINLIKDKEYLSFKKSIINILLIVIGSLFSLMQPALLYNLFGNYGNTPIDFNKEHMFVIAFSIFLMVLSFQLMKNKTQNSKNAFILFLALAAFFQYFYMRREDLAALPLHLCNLAIILLLLATLFNLKGVFYFTYFANVIGAILAIALPNYTIANDFFSTQVIHFGYNHLYALAIPILAVALKRFEKPSLKSMLQALGIFTIYYVVILFLNAWFNNYTLVDYFFAYDDFLSSKFDFANFSLLRIQYQYVLSFTFNGLEFKFFWVYQLIYFIGFIFVMFLSWYVYDKIFITIDYHKDLSLKLKQMKMDHLNLLESVGKKGLKNRMKEEKKNMIRIENFSKKYGKSKHYAVKDFSLEIKPGEIFGFLGPNGAGKSTTIKSMVGIQTITEGEIYIDGFSIKSQPIEAKLKIGYVSDNHAVYEKLTGREYIYYVSNLYLIDKDIRDKRLEELSVKLKLDHALDQEVKSYSHGMKQKLVVIASLIHEPPVWILDEPLTGLDPNSSYEIKEIMKEYAKKGNIVFFSSHVIEVVEKICTRIAIIDHGNLKGIYDVNDLLKNKISLESLYIKEEGEVK